MITQSLKDLIAGMTEPELHEVLECVEKRADKLPAGKLFDPFIARTNLAAVVRIHLNSAHELLDGDVSDY